MKRQNYLYKIDWEDKNPPALKRFYTLRVIWRRTWTDYHQGLSFREALDMREIYAALSCVAKVEVLLTATGEQVKC